jgi:cytochrome oxidase Cu insertion factor (SCO1/SenC/PrrC family)
MTAGKFKCLVPLIRAGLVFASILLCQLPSAASSLWQLDDEFVDEFGTRARLSHWAGAQTIVAMEYSACKFVCTVNWRRLQDIQSEADKQKIPLNFLIISIDPKNDSPAAWRDYRKVRDLNRNNWNFVTGNRKATDRVIATLGVKWWLFDDSIMHDFKVLRYDAAGNRLAVMENFDDPVKRFLKR